MTDVLKLILISVANIMLCYIIWLLIKPTYSLLNDKNKKVALDKNIKKLEDWILIEKSEDTRVFILQQLKIMRNDSNALAVRIALSGN